MGLDRGLLTQEEKSMKGTREPQTAGPVLLRRDVLLAGGSLFAVLANTTSPYIAAYADLQNAPVVCL
jgi:hypothetical protein